MKQEDPNKQLSRFNIEELCEKSYSCTDIQCQLYHPRVVVGICLKFIKDQNCDKKCGNTLHKELEDVQEKFADVSTINGLYWWNLCEKQEQCTLNLCQYIHRDWLKDYCIQCFKNRNCNNDHSVKQKILWKELKGKIEQDYQFNQKKLDDLENDDFLKKQNFCYENFFGKCIHKEVCTKPHIDWEKFYNQELVQIQMETLKKCSNEDYNKLQDYIKKSQSYQPFSVIFWKELQDRLHRNSISEDKTIDFLLILDCTKSMDKWIEITYKSLQSIIEFVKSQVGMRIRVGFIGYRDIPYQKKIEMIKSHFGNNLPQDYIKTNLNQNIVEDYQQFERIPFTEDIQKVISFIKKIKAVGGGDEAEDLIGALDQGLKLNFSESSESILFTLLMTDSVCHGKQYHDIDDDDLMDVIPPNTLEYLMQNYKSKKLNSFFYVLKLKTSKDINNQPSTEKMFKIMKENFTNLGFLSEKPEFKEFTNYLNVTLVKSVKDIKEQKQDDNFFYVNAIYEKIHFPRLPQNNDVNYWLQFPQTLKQCIYMDKCSLKISKEPVILIEEKNQGQCSSIYRIFDKIWNLDLVAKISKDQENKFKDSENIHDPCEKVKILNEIKEIAEREAYSRFYSTAYAYQLARKFRHITKSVKGCPKLFYVAPFIFRLDFTFKGSNIIYAENFINYSEDKIFELCKGTQDQITQYKGFQKFTGNDTSLESHIFSAFSHYTYEETKGNLIVCDLQGFANILTDPAIHSRNLPEETQTLLNHSTNDGHQGIIKVKDMQHSQCNDVCKFLNYQNQNLRQTRVPIETQDTLIICFVCNRMMSVNTDHYIKHMSNGDIACEECTQQLQKKTQANCICCRQKFEYSEYKSMKQTNTIPLCCDCCQEKCIKVQNDNSCEYCQSKCQFNLKKKEIQGKTINFCEQSFQYLRCIRCYKCGSFYKFQELIDPDIYNKNLIYYCQDCRNK